MDASPLRTGVPPEGAMERPQAPPKNFCTIMKAVLY